MHAQKCNWGYRASKPDREPKRSDSWGKIGAGEKQGVHELYDNQCAVFIALQTHVKLKAVPSTVPLLLPALFSRDELGKKLLGE